MLELHKQALKYKTYRGFINSDKTQELIDNLCKPELRKQGWYTARKELGDRLGVESIEQLYNIFRQDLA